MKLLSFLGSYTGNGPNCANLIFSLLPHAENLKSTVSSHWINWSRGVNDHVPNVPGLQVCFHVLICCKLRPPLTNLDSYNSLSHGPMRRPTKGDLACLTAHSPCVRSRSALFAVLKCLSVPDLGFSGLNQLGPTVNHLEKWIFSFQSPNLAPCQTDASLSI